MEETTNKSGVSAGMVTIIVIIVAIIFGGGAYAYVNNKATKEKKDLNAQITQLQSQVAASETTATTTTPSSTTSATTTKTTSQNIYKNDKIGFSFQMPEGYIVSEDYTSEYESPMEVRLALSKTSGLNYEFSNVEMSVGNEQSSDTGNDALDKMVSSDGLRDVTSSKDVKISGTNGKVVETAGMGGSIAHYFALGNNQYLRFDQIKDSKLDNQELVDKIVSTFQFGK